jgi:hypothetical protein
MTYNENVERIAAWQCIGCGRIEGAQPCIGICQDRKAEFVAAADYDRLAAEAAALRKVAREIATITPRQGEWERSYRALQARARRILHEHPDYAEAA